MELEMINSPQFEDCLLLLLELFPVHVQAQLRTVCTRWNLLIEQVWRKVKRIDIEHYASYSGRHSIDKCNIVFDNNGKLSCNVCSALEQFVTREHFPNVTSLDFDFSGDDNSTSKSLLPHFLEQWTDTLTDLSVKFSSEESHKFQFAAWTQINSMKSLKSLDLCLLEFSDIVNFPNEEIHWKVPDSLSILANLEKFTLVDIKNDDFGVLAQLGPKLRHLILITLNLNNQIITSIVPKLTSLSELEILIPQFPQSYPVLDFFTSLAQLNQLSKLCLLGVQWNQFISLVTHTNGYPKLTSVKHLSMRFHNIFKPIENPRQHMDQFNEHFFACIPIMFPSLETIKVTMYGQEDQQFVDMIKNRMKRKFVALRNAKFQISHYSGGPL